MNRKETQANVPFQVQHLIDSMNNPRDNIYIRGNYRARLDYIREQIDFAINKYDTDLAMNPTKKKGY